MSEKNDMIDGSLGLYIQGICLNVKQGIDNANKELGEIRFFYPKDITIATANSAVRVTVPFSVIDPPDEIAGEIS